MSLTDAQLKLLRQIAAASVASSDAPLPNGLFHGHGPADEQVRRDFDDLVEDGFVRVESSLKNAGGQFTVLTGARPTARGNEMLGMPKGRAAERAVEALRGMWFGDTRPPGHIGKTTQLSGTINHEPSTLDRRGAGWELTSAVGEATRLSVAEAARLVLDGSFRPAESMVVPQIADVLYIQAIRQASESVTKLNQARAGLTDVASLTENPIPQILVASALDRSLAASLSATVLAIAACEAQANEWAHERGGWSDDEDKQQIVGKLRTLAAREGVELDAGRTPIQDLAEAARRRNDLVHSKPIPEPAALSGAKVARPGFTASLDSRKACLAVRQALIAVSNVLGAANPSYLVYCPPGTAGDDNAWSTAELLAGSRDDPDFPRST